MNEILVRQATLADTYAITDLHCSNADGGVFTRRNSDGTQTPVTYEELSLFERFMNGGPWMSVETCAVWLAYLLRYGDEIPLVVESDGVVLGEAEVSIGNEPAPYGRHLHITTLKVHQDSPEELASTLLDALVNYIKQMAVVMRVQQVTVTPPDALYAAHAFEPLVVRRQVVVPAKIGRVVYKATPNQQWLPSRIDGWYMPFGRWQNARSQWSGVLPGFWNAVPELVEPEVARFEIELAGQRGFLLLQQNRYRSQRAEGFLWTERVLSSQMVSAIRDRAAREGYEELALFVDDKSQAHVEADAVELGDPDILLSWRVV